MKPNHFKPKTLSVEVDESALESQRGAFEGVLNLGLLTSVRLPGEQLPDMERDELKERLRRLAGTCAEGVKGVGMLLQYLPQEHGPTGKDLWDVGGLLENLGELIGEAMERTEALDMEARSAELEARRERELKAQAAGVFAAGVKPPKKKPGNGGTFPGFMDGTV